MSGCNEEKRYGVKWGRFPRRELDWAACGTEAQAQAHRRRGEKPCTACKEADLRARRDRIKRSKQMENAQ